MIYLEYSIIVILFGQKTQAIYLLDVLLYFSVWDELTDIRQCITVRLSVRIYIVE
jgi:hypothetical protein